MDTGPSIHTLMDSLSPWNSFVFPRVSPTHSLPLGSSASYAFAYEGCGRPRAGRKTRRWESGTAGASWVVELTRVLRPPPDITGLLSSTFVPTKFSPPTPALFPCEILPTIPSVDPRSTPLFLTLSLFSSSNVSNDSNRLARVASLTPVTRGVRRKPLSRSNREFSSVARSSSHASHHRSVARAVDAGSGGGERDGGGNGGGGGGASVPPYPPKHEHRDSPHTCPRIFGTITPGTFYLPLTFSVIDLGPCPVFGSQQYLLIHLCGHFVIADLIVC